MWTPIADSETSRRCWNAIEGIERGLAAHMEADQSPLLTDGKAGQALFFAYLDAAREGQGNNDRALDILGHSIDALAERELSPDLYTGFCGIGWAVEHLNRELFVEDEDLCGALDEALGGLLAHLPEETPYELIGGLAGYGTYLLERLPNPGAARLLVRILDLLEAGAETSEAGTTWFTPPGWLPGWQRESMPEGCHNLGVAHGVPGLIGFLAAAKQRGVDDPRVSRLAEGAVRWLLAQKLPPGMPAAFPFMLVPGRRPDPAASPAWCYGDLGISAVLLAAARSFGRADWEEEALSLARHVARRSGSKGEDSSLCHGAAGNGHLFNRLYQATGDPEMREAALGWYRQTLDQRKPGEGLAGFLTWVVSPGSGAWSGHPGFLIGAAGVGLALLAAVTDREPVWDRVMLTSIPPRRQ